MQVGDPSVRWWAVRGAQNRRPATYRCPLCGKHLPALSEHILIAPEGDTTRRRHAHTTCAPARTEGRPTAKPRRVARSLNPAKPGLLSRLLRRD